MKRLRTPKLKNGELALYWGREPRGTPEVMMAYQGDGLMKRDRHLLYNVMFSQHPDIYAKPLFSKMHPSFLEELEARGYDLTTLKFSIMKKKNEETT